ncbi:MAG: DNA polymerase IV [Chloroflexi bacterium]|nr:MAG: DNA polymerase IV [Chloroflexota bacterium]
MPRKIIHLDLDAFFCAVEEIRDPALRGKAFAVGGKPDQRGVISSCSYAARQCGVHSAMPTGQALRLCPELIVLPGRHHVYGDTSRQVMACLGRYTPLLEQISIDEAFLDVSDINEPGEVITKRIQSEIKQELQLPCSIGLAANKLVAKIATDVGKAANRSANPPCAITVVPPGQEAQFLAPLPVSALWGVGPKTEERLAGLGIHTIGDIANWPVDSLVNLFGKHGQELAQRSRGIDTSPITTTHTAKSISQETTFAKDTSSKEFLRQKLLTLSEGVGRQLRASHLCGSTVKLKLRWSDFSTITRQVTLPQPTDQDKEIYLAALDLFEKAWKPRHPVRLIGVGVSGLGPPAKQLGLWYKVSEKDRRLQETLDELREKYGSRIVRRGAAKDDD